MSVLNGIDLASSDRVASPRAKMKMLQQMAEALEDEASSLNRRAMSLEEEDFLVNREIEEHQTEINRLRLKLEVIRSERDGLLQRSDALKDEAGAIREEIFNGEETTALSTISEAREEAAAGAARTTNEPARNRGRLQELIFFHRTTVIDFTG